MKGERHETYLKTGVMLMALTAVVFAVDTKTDYDHSTDFTRYHSFAWKEAKRADGVVANSLVLSRIQTAVAEKLGTPVSCIEISPRRLPAKYLMRVNPSFE
jgi:hypothetical protein